MKHGALPPTLAPRGLGRAAAAEYWSLSPTKFDQLVRDGRAPKPKIIDGRKVWDVRELDVAFSELPSDGDTSDAANPWDEE